MTIVIGVVSVLFDGRNPDIIKVPENFTKQNITDFQEKIMSAIQR